MILYTKEELIEKIKTIFSKGWHRSVKDTLDKRNDGAVGNTFETLLGINENNLPIPNVAEWELKGQRAHTTSLITLKHSEPSPRGARIVANMLLPKYGWKHKNAGSKYPASEMSFRSTTSTTSFTKRGFRIVIDRVQRKMRFVFDSSMVDTSDPKINAWLHWVDERVGLGAFNPEPYWGFDDLKHEVGSKIKNCFYIIADTRIKDSKEYFLYKELYTLSRFSFNRFLDCFERGGLLVDFDARTGHNHGTKFRIKQGYWKEIYETVERVI